MLGVVRLFCDQVKETEKEADSCLRRVLAPKLRTKRATLTPAADTDEKEEDAGNLMTMWREGRRLLELIDYAPGPAPGLLSMRYTSTLPPEQASAIWRDTEDPSLSYSDAEEMRGDGENGFIEVPRRAPIAVWNLPASSYIPEDVDHARGEEIRDFDMELRPGDSLDFGHQSNNSESVHFLDMLLERHESGGFDGTLESTLSLLQESSVQRRISDLLAPEFMDDSDEEPPSQGLYDPGINILHDEWAAVDAGGMDTSIDGAPFDLAHDALSQASLGSLGTHPLGSTDSSTKKKRSRAYPIDETTTIPHEESRALVATFNPPRPNTTPPDSKSLKLRQLEKEKLGTLPQVMGLRESEVSQVSGALAYLLLSHQTSVRIPLPDIGPLTELSYLPQEEANDSSGGEISNNAFLCNPSFISPAHGSSDQLDTSNGDCIGEIYRGDIIDGGEGGAAVNFNTAFGADVDDYDDAPDFGPSSYGAIDLQHEERAPHISLEDSYGQVSISGLGSSEGGHISPRVDDLTHSSLVSAPQEAKGLSKALLNYLALKTTVDLSQSSDSSQHALSNREKSASTDECDLVSSFSGDRNSYSISQLLKGCKRRTAARAFLHLLELASISSISLEQEEPFTDIDITVLTAHSAPPTAP